MNSYPTLRRWLAGAVTAAVLAGVVLIGALSGRSGAGDKGGEQKKAAGARDGDWVMYGGSPSRNMANTRVKGLPAEWDIGDPRKKIKPKNIKWVADLGSLSYGGPIVVGGKVIVGTNNQKPRNPKDRLPNGQPLDLGVVMGFNEADGKFLWQTTYRKLPSGLVHDWPKQGICSTPVAEGDRMYYVSNRCEVVCSGLDGKIHWKLDMMGQLGVFPHNLSVCSPLLIGDKLFVVTANGVDEDHLNVPAPRAPSFIRVNKRTGQVEWQDNRTSIALLQAPKKGKKENRKDFFKKLVNEAKLIQHGQWSNPACAVVKGKPQVVFPGGDGWIYSFDPNSGKLIWKFDCNPKDAKYELGGKGTRSDFIATPVIYEDRVYIGTGQDPEHEYGVGHLWCIDMTREGDVSPELVTDRTVWPPKTKPNPNSAKVWHFGGPADPKKTGRNYHFGRTMSTCAIHDGLVYAGELDGHLHCLDAKKGTVYWSHNTKAQTWSSPVYADGKVYFGNDSQTMWVFAHGKQKRLLAENDLDGYIRAAPVVANGTLYVMTVNKLYAIAAK
jgi:outer membrane protein assembly factor BamB